MNSSPTGNFDRAQLLTEQRLVDSMDLDRMPLPQALALMQREDARAVAAVAQQAPAVMQAVICVSDALREGGRLLYVGAGTSGRLGVLDASECPPTFGADPQQVRGILAGGMEALTESREGAEDHEDGGVTALKAAGVTRRDVVMGIAASGATPFVRGALHYAAQVGAATIFLCCVEPTPLEPRAQIVIRPLTGPEVLTGSTRLKAGTATKLVLNQITTLAMVQLGKVYENLMVDLKASNAKLRDRAIRIVSMAAGVGRDQAQKLLGMADGEVKTAIVMQRRGIAAPQARRFLLRSDGRLRAALEAPAEL